MNAEIDVRDVILTTPRLTLRPWGMDDIEDFYAYARVDGVGQMARWRPHGSREESARVLRGFIEGRATFALERGGRVIGSLGIERYDEERFPELAALRCRELGYALAKDCWGQGLMPEAANAAIRWLFEDVGLDAILCGHFLRNLQSARVQEKCGFRHYAFGVYRTRMGTVEDDEKTILRREAWARGK